MTEAFTWQLFDWMGTIAFAVSGAMVGLSKKMDMFGITVLAVLVAVGGGMTRDVIAGLTPPMALQHPTDLVIAIVTAFVVSIIYETVLIDSRRRKRVSLIYNIFDTVGLGSFTVTGVMTGFSVPDGNYWALPVMLGFLTAVGGGILRDLFAQRVPVVLNTDVYATASIAGALIICAANLYIGIEAAVWVGFMSVLIIRAVVLRFNLHLYHPKVGRWINHSK
ncbi:MAG: TRIC cation channel family protein [Veillonellaceae bacterium]|nr:TRIC cation channel family protein [Veillonellaceae bacterium]MDD6924135.1 TRIC cation channel family protein [Veillonellaceae bacterium]